MRKASSICVVLVALFCMVKAAFADSAKVIAYYFHGTFRCYTCTLLEQYSREAIEANFQDMLKTGTLEFRAVNVEDRKHDHFVKEYQLITKSLVLSLMKDGKEIKSKNLSRIWELVRNKQKFTDYVAAEVRDFVKETK